MFNFLSQHIAHDFEASQSLLDAPSQVCSIASCGPGYMSKQHFQLNRFKPKSRLTYSFQTSVVSIWFFSSRSRICMRDRPNWTKTVELELMTGRARVLWDRYRLSNSDMRCPSSDMGGRLSREMRRLLK